MRIQQGSSSRTFYFFLALASYLASTAQAQTADDAQRAADALRQAQERTQQLKPLLEPAPQVRLSDSPAVPFQGLVPDEIPCFTIRAVEILVDPVTGISLPALSQALKGPAGDDDPQGRCLGAQSVSRLIQRVQDALIAQGFVTSRVLAQPQDLSQGSLTLQVLPGRIQRIRLARPDERVNLFNALPMSEGDVLQLRDVEQALENLKRVPTVEADIQIEPGQEPGTSDLVVSWSQGKVWRLYLTADDSGSPSSGRYQGSATFSYDHALTLNDLFYITTSSDLGGGDPGYRGTRGLSLHYSLPIAYGLLALNSSRNRYFQSVAGANQDYVYSGISHSQDIQFTHLFHRDAVSKTSWSIKAFARQSENFIDDTEVEVQRRRVGGYELGLQHKTQWSQWQVDSSLAYKQGSKSFGANQAPEDLFGEGTHQFKLLTASMQWQLPLRLGNQRWQYQGNWRWQNNRTPLTPQDRFSIGGRHTVRGFDGASSLSGDRGWLLRNELSTALAGSAHQAYLALDHGHVDGPSAQNLLGQRLTGLVFGLRGKFGPTQYEVFVGTPVRMPTGFRTAPTTYGMSLSASF